MSPTRASSLLLAASLTIGSGLVSAQEPVETTPDLSSVMAELAPIIAKHTAAIGYPALSSSELARAQRGELVIRETKVSGAPLPRLTMATVMPYPVEAMYLVLGDLTAHADFVPQLDHSVILKNSKAGMVREAFQYMGAPYPAQDRGWINKMENNTGLYAASGGRVWQLPWSMQCEEYKVWLQTAVSTQTLPTIVPVDLDDLQDATVPNFGGGAWTLVPLGQAATYVRYDAFTDPNPNSIEKGFVSALGTKVQTGMFSDLAPLAAAYADGRQRTSDILVDMQGKSSKGLIEALRKLRAASGR